MEKETQCPKCGWMMQLIEEVPYEPDCNAGGYEVWQCTNLECLYIEAY